MPDEAEYCILGKDKPLGTYGIKKEEPPVNRYSKDDMLERLREPLPQTATGLALIPCEGLIVTDVDFHCDTYTPSNHPALFLQSHGFTPQTLTVKSPSGDGRHFYYFLDKNLIKGGANGVNQFQGTDLFNDKSAQKEWEDYKATLKTDVHNKPITAIDIRTGYNGYIAIPGSIKAGVGTYTIHRDLPVSTLTGVVINKNGKSKGEAPRAKTLDELISDGPPDGVTGRNEWFKNFTKQMVHENIKWDTYTPITNHLLIRQDNSDNEAVTMDECKSLYDRYVEKQGGIPIGGDVGKLCKNIASRCYHIDKFNISDIDWHTIEATYNNAVMTSRTELMAINDVGVLTYATKKEYTSQLAPMFHGDYTTPCNHKADIAISESIAKRIHGYRLRKLVNVKTDFYTDIKKFSLNDDSATLEIPHVPFHTGPYDLAIIEEYKKHFPSFDMLLAAIVASKFSRDRKLASLLLKVKSDWGKSGLLNMLVELGMVYTFDPEEMKIAINGKPSGIDVEAFSRAWVLVLDEAVSFPHWLLRLENWLDITPKNKQKVRVEVALRLVMGRQNIKNLTEEMGNDPQISNRFSELEAIDETIFDLPIFSKVNNIEYRRSLTNYMGETLNKLVDHYLSLSKNDAAYEGLKVLTSMHDALGIKHSQGDVSDNLDDVVDELHGFIDRLQYGDLHSAAYRDMRDRFISVVRKGGTQRLAITSPSKFFKAWVKSEHDDSYNIKNLRDEILLALDYRGSIPTDNRGSIQWKVKIDNVTRRQNLLLLKTDEELNSIVNHSWHIVGPWREAKYDLLKPWLGNKSSPPAATSTVRL